MKRGKKLSVGISLFLVCILVFGLIPHQSLGAGEKKLNLTYIHTGNTTSYVDMVDKTRNSLDEVCPCYFSITASGSLYINNTLTSAFISEMHKRGIKVIPYLSNSWDRALGQAAIKNREQLANQIADAVRKYDLDGVDVDIENLTQDDRANYVDFVKKLRQKMGNGKVISVAVSANPGGATTGWAGSYDYTGLAAYCDYLLVMTYDEHYQGSSPGPVASAKFVENSIIYALGKVPKEKILLGIPFYGRYWKTGAATGGYGIANVTVDALIKKYNGKVEYDTVQQTPKAVITIKPGDPVTPVNGVTLSAGTYTFWFENEQSYKYKLRLVQKYGLRGTGSWALGQEVPQVWDYYTQWLNGKYFTDIEGHWAQAAIFEVDSLGWMTGSTSTLFKPNNSLTRAEAATILVRALGLKTDNSPAVFPDITNHWAKNEINAAYKAGLIKGSNGLFNPNKSITREEMAVILDRALKLEDIMYDYNLYPDVNPNNCSWSFQAICNTTYYGLFQGSDGVFKPQNMLSRGEMATIMVRVAKFMEIQAQPTPTPSQTPAATLTPSPTPSQMPAVTPTPSPAPSQTPAATPTPSPALSQSPAATPTPSPAPSQTPAATKTPKPAVPKASPTPTLMPV